MKGMVITLQPRTLECPQHILCLLLLLLVNLESVKCLWNIGQKQGTKDPGATNLPILWFFYSLQFPPFIYWSTCPFFSPSELQVIVSWLNFGDPENFGELEKKNINLSKYLVASFAIHSYHCQPKKKFETRHAENYL